MRKYILVSILGAWMMQSPIQAEILETLSDSTNVRETVTQTINITQIQTKYIPPALSLERKSLRIINMPNFNFRKTIFCFRSTTVFASLRQRFAERALPMRDIRPEVSAIADCQPFGV